MLQHIALTAENKSVNKVNRSTRRLTHALLCWTLRKLSPFCLSLAIDLSAPSMRLDTESLNIHVKFVNCWREQWRRYSYGAVGARAPGPQVLEKINGPYGSVDFRNAMYRPTTAR